MIKKILTLSTVVLLATLVSCKPSAEKELVKFGYYKKSIKEYKKKLPAFETQLTSLFNESDKKMKKAVSEVNTEKRAVKMRKINKEILKNKLYKEFKYYVDYQAVLKKDRRNLNRKIMKASNYQIVSKRRNSVSKKLEEMETNLKTLKPKNNDEAYELIKEVNALLKSIGTEYDLISFMVIKKEKKSKKKNKNY